jgi:hypothetical protein
MKEGEPVTFVLSDGTAVWGNAFWVRGSIPPVYVMRTANHALRDADEGTLWERGWTNGETLHAARLLVQSYSGD